MRRFAFASLAIASVLGTALVASCGGGSGGGEPLQPFDDAGDATATDGSSGSETGGSGGLDGSFDTSTGCVEGTSCGDGGTCVGGACCEDGRACGDACCGAGQVCSFLKCVTPGAVCNDSTDCAPGEYCEPSLGSEPSGPDPADAGPAPDASGDGGACVGGAVPREGRCLPKPPRCETGDAGVSDAGASDAGSALTCLEACEVRPPVATSFTPTVKYAWGGKTTAPYDTDIMMTPIVIELDDDDCDGKITARDIPEIVFSTFASGAYKDAGVLHAISVVSGAVVEKWSVEGVSATKQLAGGNVDAKPGNEVIACWSDGTVKALRGDGSVLWTSAPMDCLMPSIADLDGDGIPEVIVEGGILNGEDGTLKHAWAEPLKGPPVVSDVDSDGKLEIVTGPQIFEGDGTLLVDSHVGETSEFGVTSDWKFPGAAIADFDKDGKPEIVVMHNLDHRLWVWRYDPSAPSKYQIVREGVDINGSLSPSLCTGWGNAHGGGPPTIADFDGDGTPDVALAGGVGYAVFDGKKLIDPTVDGPDTFLWIKQTRDCSSASTGSTVFDFDGDGKAEVVYSDERYLRIYRGETGEVLFETCNTTATLIENPVVADVDNDGQADIVVVSNAYAGACADDATTRYSGVRIFGDAAGKWVRTRRVWNEHAYHVTNVNEDGTIPASEPANWTTAGLNNFRQNKQPGGEFAAPDAVVSLEPRCPGPSALLATVRNLGEAVLPEGAEVEVWKGAPGSAISLGKASTTRALYPAESETLAFALSDAEADVKNGTTDVWATVAPKASVQECRPENNASQPMKAKCSGPK